MTSSGHVTMPEAMPADAPQKAFTVLFGRLANTTARLDSGAARLLGWFDALVVVGDGGGSGSEVIVQAAHDGTIR
jgi:hypothetical protein